jgi:GNAT superfamily N-acetyltransferase
MNFISEPLDSNHRKAEFNCGNEQLDNYFYKQASQDVKRKLSACFVVAESETYLVKGYYTLSNNSIPLEAIPDTIKRKLPSSYAAIPVTLMGRLAIEIKYQGQGLGKFILIDALKRCFVTSKSIGSFAVVVDPIDHNAQAFYLKYGFITLPDSRKMFLPMRTIAQLFA